MELSLLLAKTIATMFLMMAMGYIIIKAKLLTPEQGKVISILLLYVVCPCMIVSSFQMEYSTRKLTGLLLTTASAAVVHGIFILLSTALKKPLKLTGIEQISIIYPNSGNLIMPIILSVLGKEWVFYCTGFLIVQTFLMWTHAKSVASRQLHFDWKKIVLNLNIIVLVISIGMFLGRVKLPAVICGAFDNVGSTMGPLSMLTIGMLLGEKGILNIIKDKKAYLICFLRVIICPLIVVAIIGLTGIEKVHPDGWNIMFIVLVSSGSSTAATVTQFAQMYGNDASHASIINVMGVLMCIVTMPLAVMLYQFLT